VPDVATLESSFETLGLELHRAIVIVPEGKNDTDLGAAARVYWTLKSSGFSDLSILHGGIAAWRRQNMAITADAVSPQPTELDIDFSNSWTAQTEQSVPCCID